MRKENIDHFFKYGTFPYGEWFEGSNKAAGKLPVATTPSLLDTSYLLFYSELCSKLCRTQLQVKVESISMHDSPRIARQHIAGE